MPNDMKNMLPAERPVQQRKSFLLDPASFEHAQRAAKVLAITPMFPAHLRSGNQQEAIANAVMVLNLADRLNEDPLAIAQSIFFVGGKPGWEAKYLIARANQHGVFKGRINWKVSGEGNSLSVTAYATLADTGERVEATADMKMAIAENWTKNKKYQTMPELMLRYRSATFLVRLYCPEVTLGYSSMEELEDVRFAEAKDITPEGDAPETTIEATGEIIESAPEPEPEEKPQPEKKPAAKKTAAKPKPEPEPEKADDEGEKAAQENEDESEGDPLLKLPEEHQQTTAGILGQIDLAETTEAVTELIEMFETDLDRLEQECLEAHDLIVAASKEKREALGG